MTTCQAASIVGVTQTTISHFENSKRAVQGFRVEQFVRAYGYTMEQFNKIISNNTVLSFKDDCITMIDLMDDEQLAAIRVNMIPREFKSGERVDEWPLIVLIDFGSGGTNYELKDVKFTYGKDSWSHPRITRQKTKFRIDGVKGWIPGSDLKIDATIVDTSSKKKSTYRWSTPLKCAD